MRPDPLSPSFEPWTIARIAGRWIAFGCAGTLAFVIVALVALQIPAVQSVALEQGINRAGASYGIRAKVVGPGGVWPWRVRANELRFLDSQGEFAQVTDVDIRLDPFALLGKRLDLGRIAIGGGQYLRRPILPEREAGPFRLPSFPARLGPAIDIAVDEFLLGPFDVHAGDQVSRIEGGGAIRLTGEGLDGSIDLTAGEAGSASLRALVEPATRSVDVTLTVSDPGGQWLTPLMPLAPGTPIRATLSASGPRENITLTSEAGWGAASVRLDGTLAWEEDLAGTIEATLSRILPDSLADVAGLEQRLESIFRVSPDGAIVLERMNAVSSSFAFEMAGTVDTQLALAGTVSHSGGPVLASRLGLESVGAINADFHIGGTRRSMQISSVSQVSGAASEGISATRIGTDVASVWSREGGVANTVMRAVVEGLSGARVPSALSGQALELQTNFQADFTHERMDIRESSGNWGPLAFDAAGEIAAEGPMRIDGQIAVADLSAIDSRLLGVARIEATGRRARRGGPLSVDVHGTTEQFSAGDEVAAILGRSPQMTLQATIDDDRIEFSRAQINLAALHTAMSGTIDRITQAMDISGSYDIADLSILQPGLTGSLEGAIEVGGTAAAPDFVLSAVSPLIQMGVARAESISAQANMMADRGALHVDARINGEPLVLRFPFTRAGGDIGGDVHFQFAEVLVTGPAQMVGGVPRAQLHAEAARITPLVTFLRQIGGIEDALVARGAASGDFVLEDSSGTLAIHLDGPGIEGMGIPAQASAIDLDLALQLSAEPGIDGSLTAENLRFGPSHFSLLDAKARGPLGALEAALSLRGPAEDPFHLEATALRRESGAGSEVTLLSVDGESLDFQIALAGGGRINVGPNGVELGPTSFAISNRATGRTGTLAAEARLWAGAPYAQLSAENVPAGSLAVFGIPVDWTGILDGTVTLDARGNGPPLVVALSASDLTNDPDIAPLDVRLDARAGGQTLEGMLVLTDSANSSELLVAQSSMPLMWRHGSFAPIIEWDVPLSGTARVDAPLERLWLFVPVDSLSVRGRVSGDIEVAGTAAVPLARGEVRLSDGALEQYRTGFILRDATGTVTFTDGGGLAAIVRATDGNGGRAGLNVTAHLSREEAWAVDGALRMEALSIARRDEIRAEATGNLRLSGTMTAARLEGAVTMDRIDAQIPNQLAPSVVDLPVVRVNGTGEVEDAPGAKTATRGLDLPLDLDLQISIPRRAFIRGRGLDSEWGGELAILGTMESPRIDGTLNVLRGTFDLSRTRFSLTEGRIDFLGGDRIDPRILVQAEAPGPEFKSILRAQGTVRRPTITITSDPVMPQETVMAQILFGKRPEELSAFELVQIAEASASLSGSGGIDLLGSARRAVGLDVLSIGARETSAGGQDVNVTVGRYVTRNVFVGARRGLEPGSGAVTVEMEVTPEITVDAEVRQDTEGSVGVEWRWDY